MPHRPAARPRSRTGVGVASAVAVLMAVSGLWTPAHAAGTSYFVSPSGVDTNSGTSASTPFRTLQRALDLAQPGTTINLAPGTYKQAVVTKVAGTAAAPITVKGPETGKAAGGRFKAVLVSPAGRAFSINHSYYTLDGFTIDGQPNIAHTEYDAVTSLADVKAKKDTLQARAVNSKLVYVGAATTSADIVGTTLSNMFLTGSGGECVRFRNRSANSLITDSVIQWCGLLRSDNGVDGYEYHNAEGVYIGTSLVSTDQPMAANDASNNIVVRNSTVNTFGSECFEVKENAHHNRFEKSDCGFNDEPLSFRGSNIELRGDHNLVVDSRVTGSRSWNVKLWSDAPEYDRGGNSIQKTRFSGATGASIHNQQAGPDTVFCGNTFATSPAAEGLAVDPTQACPDTTAPTAPANLKATAASSTSVGLTWTAATDDVGVTAYDVLRNGAQITTTATTTYTDSALTASTGYSYTVRARDAAGNTSPVSNTASVTTPAAQTTPTPPAVKTIIVEAEAGTLTAPMAPGNDTKAQGGQYVSQASGTGVGKDTITVTVPTAGRYTLALRAISPSPSSDSFNYAVDGGATAVFNLGTHTAWSWVNGPTVLTLTAGQHKIVVSKRENGARLDAVRLTPAP